MRSDDPSPLGLRLKLWPLLAVAVLALALPYLAGILALLSSRVLHTPSRHGAALPWLYMQHGLQLLLALVAIAVVRRFVPADYGLHWPARKTYLLPALLWGALFGVLMTLIDYAPQLIAHSKPDPGFPLSRGNIIGWLFFEGVYVGPTRKFCSAPCW